MQGSFIGMKLKVNVPSLILRPIISRESLCVCVSVWVSALSLSCIPRPLKAFLLVVIFVLLLFETGFPSVALASLQLAV